MYTIEILLYIYIYLFIYILVPVIRFSDVFGSIGGFRVLETRRQGSDNGRGVTL